MYRESFEGFLTPNRLHVGHTKRSRATAGGVAAREPPSKPTNKPNSADLVLTIGPHETVS
jgi:hypothetical protein